MVAGLLTQWQERIESGVRRTNAKNPEKRAMIILSALQGGVQLLLATGDSTALRVALDAALEGLI